MDAFLLGFAAWQREYEREKDMERTMNTVKDAAMRGEIDWITEGKLESQIRINYGKGTWEDEFNLKYK